MKLVPPDRRGRILLLGLFLLGLGLRIAFLFQVKDQILFRSPILDSRYYLAWAREILGGDWLGAHRGVFTMSPGYPYFLAGLFALSSSTPFTAAAVQLLLGLLTAMGVFLLARRHFPGAAGYLAAAFYLFYGPAIFMEGSLVKAASINALNVGILLLFSWTGPAVPLLGGLLTGLSAHFRPTILLFAPVLAAWIWRGFPRRRRALIHFTAGILLALAPVAARNLAVGGEAVPLTAHGGMNFYSGNAPESVGPYRPLPFARTDPRFEQGDFVREASRRAGRSLTPAESSRFWYRESFSFIARHPSEWLLLLGKKLLACLNRYEAPINLDYTFFRTAFRSVLSLPLPGFGLLMPLAAVGLFLGGRNLLLHGYLLACLAGNLLFLTAAEYRFPAVPVVAVYAAYGVTRIPGMLRRGGRPLAMTTVLLVISLFAVNVNVYRHPLGLPNYEKESVADGWYNLGVSLADEGRTVEAEEAFSRATEIIPHVASLLRLCSLADDAGDTDAAVEYCIRAIAAAPGSAAAYNDLGAVLLTRRRDYPGAVQAFRRATELDPSLSEARENLAAALNLLNQP